MHCKQCNVDVMTCCAKHILDHQPDFKEQKSLVQEVIEAAGHIAIFLPKFHCEINFIEYFWGAVKHYLWENCDYTYEGLKTHLDAALHSVSVSLICKWEQHMWHWVEAYQVGLNAKDAQLQVKNFSSRKYTSHHRVSENVAWMLDL
ncbi:hypothetical protein FISHEDRAFT_42317 [Fistulina hepatica ATCC 64428]|uniref:Tc1-like transposase DDE domain-containing protein n=1 Tax=Fistulina hepatica ATCC 64428 TaxID=1128425 RepID=A0A0D7AD75_9AGAR|nr:hypothetical protein FISHEDRAFT_42317 [Fistulina hepatica ATCC 64428]